jgi:hypothetical protein
VPQAAGFAQGRRGPHDSRLVAYVYCDMPVAGWGLSGSICLVMWLEVSKRWKDGGDEAQHLRRDGT